MMAEDSPEPMTRAERREKAATFRHAIKVKMADMLTEHAAKSSPEHAAVLVDEFIHFMKCEHPDLAGTINQAHREFARELDAHFRKHLSS